MNRSEIRRVFQKSGYVYLCILGWVFSGRLLSGAGGQNGKLPEDLSAYNSALPAGVHRITKDTDPPSDYILQAGDVITVRVYEVPDLDDTVRIRPDGKVSFQLVTETAATGRTVEDLRSELTRRYSKYYRNPEVSLIVRTFANLKVFVCGEVEHPGMMPLDGTVTALQAIAQAGGARPTGRMDGVILVHDNPRGPVSITRLNLKRIMEGGAEDMPLHAFDVVYVPASKITKVDRFVEQYVRGALPTTLSAGFTYLLGNTVHIVP